MNTAATIAPVVPARSGRKMLAVVAALVLATLIANVFLVAWAESVPSSGLSQAVIGAVLAQLVLLGIWLALGDGRWYLRLLFVLPLNFASSAGVDLAESLATQSRESGAWAMIGFFFLMAVLTSCLAVLPLRRLREWRFTYEPAHDDSAPSPLGQVNIADYLFWMIPFGGLLSIIRFMMSIRETFVGQLSEFFFDVAALLTTVLAALLVVFSTRPRGWRKWLLLAALVLLVGLVHAAPEIYRNFQQTKALLRGSISLFVIVANACRTGSHGVSIILGAGAGATLNSFLLRRLGFRLAWR